MKKPSTIISFVVIIVLSVVLGAWLFSVSKAKTDQSDYVSVNQAKTNTVWRTDSQTADGTRYVSERYGFSLTLPASYSEQVISSYGQENLAVEFTRPNANTGEEQNRNTPDGFNTAADDTILLRAFTNDNQLTVQQSEQMRIWIANSMPSEAEITLYETRTVGNNNVLFAHQLNGIGATGQYFYFFSPDTIFVIDSNDVPEEELQAIAATVSIGQE